MSLQEGVHHQGMLSADMASLKAGVKEPVMVTVGCECLTATDTY